MSGRPTTVNASFERPTCASIRTARGKERPDRMEAAGDAFHDRVADGFRELAGGAPDWWIVIDGTGSVDDVAVRVRAALDAWIDRD